jgi:hypothetical protein
MTTRRRLLLFGLFAGLTVLGVGVSLIRPRPTAITPENAAKIQEGMTLDEVEAILGGPARHETTGLTASAGDGWKPPAHLEHVEWHSDQAWVKVYFRENGCAAASHWWPVRRVQESYLATLRRWLRL